MRVAPDARRCLKHSYEPQADRYRFVAGLDKTKTFLEVGPYYYPSLRGENVRYFDVFSTDELRQKASRDADPSVVPEGVPHLHYQNDQGDLSTIEENFDAVFSAHCIEHQPDLAGHLNQVADLLHSGGNYYLIVPDHRYCFDQPRPTSTIGAVLEAYTQKRTRHSIQSLVDHATLTTHNDSRRHWAGDHGERDWQNSYLSQLRATIDANASRSADYVDCHAWQFSPESFLNIVWSLAEIGVTRLVPEAVWLTPYRKLEFVAVLKKLT